MAAALQDLASENAALARLDAELALAPTDLRAAFALLERAADQATAIAAMLVNEEAELKGWAQERSEVG